MTPPGTARGILSPDGRRVLAQVGDSVAVYPTAGGEAQRALGFRPGDYPVRWSPDGHEIWVWADRSSVSRLRLDRVDPVTGARAPLVSIVPRELGGVRADGWLTLADDPRVYAFVQYLYMSRLYTVDGMR